MSPGDGKRCGGEGGCLYDAILVCEGDVVKNALSLSRAVCPGAYCAACAPPCSCVLLLLLFVASQLFAEITKYCTYSDSRCRKAEEHVRSAQRQHESEVRAHDLTKAALNAARSEVSSLKEELEHAKRATDIAVEALAREKMMLAKAVQMNEFHQTVCKGSRDGTARGCVGARA